MRVLFGHLNQTIEHTKPCYRNGLRVIFSSMERQKPTTGLWHFSVFTGLIKIEKQIIFTFAFLGDSDAVSSSLRTPGSGGSRLPSRSWPHVKVPLGMALTKLSLKRFKKKSKLLL